MRYEIQGETLPVVICYLDGGEKMITEGGGMSWMSPNMKMETTTNFNTVIHGPGKVWLQTMPISNVAGALRPYMPSSGK